MRFLPLLRGALCGVLLPQGIQEPPAAAPAAFVWQAVERPVLYVGERFALWVRFGFAGDTGEERRVPLFRQELDLSVELVLPFEAGAPLFEPLPPAEEPAGTTLVVNGRVERARPLGALERAGGSAEAYELERWFRAVAPGRAELSGVELRWATARRFGENLLGERVALEREEHTLRADPLALEIRALPEEGRPSHFGGAVGELALSARAEPRDLFVGESLRLEVEVTGTGSLADFDLPRAGWPGLACFGSLESRSGQARTITYDLVPESTAVREIPPLELSYFRPGPEPGYAVATTPAIPILVRPRPRAVEPGTAPEPARPSTGPGEGRGAAAGAVAAIAAGLVAWTLLALLRRSKGAGPGGSR